MLLLVMALSPPGKSRNRSRYGTQYGQRWKASARSIENGQ